MSKPTDPWIPIYVMDWERDTAHLTNEEDGAYGRLVRWYWTNGPLPDDDRKLGGIVRDHRGWKRLRPILREFFHIHDGCWYHKRIDAEKAKAIKLSEARHEIAKSGAAKRWGKTTAVVVPLNRERE